MPKSDAVRIAEIDARRAEFSEIMGLVKNPVVAGIGGVVVLAALHRAGVINDTEYEMLKIGDLAIAGGMAAGQGGAVAGAAIGGASGLSSKQIKTAIYAGAGTSLSVILLSALAAL